MPLTGSQSGRQSSGLHTQFQRKCIQTLQDAILFSSRGGGEEYERQLVTSFQVMRSTCQGSSLAHAC